MIADREVVVVCVKRKKGWGVEGEGEEEGIEDRMLSSGLVGGSRPEWLGEGATGRAHQGAPKAAGGLGIFLTARG